MQTHSSSPRDFDVVVIGATGYVGRRLVEELSKIRAQTGWRLSATVRSPQKIQELKARHPDVAFELLDVLNPRDVDALVSRARLVVSCVGPFDLYGENVVKACAGAGTHYLDITGEIHFARRMIERYDAAAKSTSAMIVPFAGFDSVPSDLGTFLAATDLRAQTGEPAASVDIVIKGRGGVNGGTAATALDMGAKLTRRDQANLSYLVPGAPERAYGHLYRPRYVAPLKRWLAPFFMETINNKVVYRTVAIAQRRSELFTPEFRYRESADLPGRALGALAVTGALEAGQTLLSSPFGRNLAKALLPKPGQGPSEKTMAEGYFKATVIATSPSGKTVTRVMRSAGDPGNVSTVKLLMACTRAMIELKSGSGGLLTPATAFGESLLPALRLSGVDWS